MDDVFKALADPSRRQLLDRLNQRGGQTLTELCAGLDMARQSVTKHLDVLEAANLVTTIRRGREKLHYLNAAPIAEIGERWIGAFQRSRVEALADLKRDLEEPMNRPEFVYTTYINTTPQKLWEALTSPDFTRRYWGLEIHSDWQPGSGFTLIQNGVTITDPAQRILQAEPYERLSYTWHTFTPEWARAVGVSEDVCAKLATEPRSKVTFVLEPSAQSVKLTVIHDDLEAGGLLLGMIGGGWPRVVASLKTLLETGEPLAAG